jgi:hypothetical protein
MTLIGYEPVSLGASLDAADKREMSLSAGNRSRSPLASSVSDGGSGAWSPPVSPEEFR